MVLASQEKYYTLFHSQTESKGFKVSIYRGFLTQKLRFFVSKEPHILKRIKNSFSAMRDIPWLMHGNHRYYQGGDDIRFIQGERTHTREARARVIRERIAQGG